MTAQLLNPPVQEPVSLAETRQWLRIDTTDEDETLLALIGAARRWAEAWLNRVLVAQDWRTSWESWPASGLVLPVAPVRAVTAVRLVDAAGVSVEAPAAHWRLDPASGRLMRLVPGPVPQGGCVEADLAAGYGQPAQTPQPIRQAILVLIAHLHAHRGDSSAPLPDSLTLLLQPYRRARIA